MNRVTSMAKSIFILYLAWILIIVTRAIWIAITGEYREKIGDEAFQSFILLFVAMMITTYAVGGALAWLTQKGKTWAKWLFILFCIYYAIDSLFGTLQISELYKQAKPYSWFRGPLSIVVWSLLAALAWKSCPNKVLHPTPKSGAAEL